MMIRTAVEYEAASTDRDVAKQVGDVLAVPPKQAERFAETLASFKPALSDVIRAGLAAGLKPEVVRTLARAQYHDKA